MSKCTALGSVFMLKVMFSTLLSFYSQGGPKTFSLSMRWEVFFQNFKSPYRLIDFLQFYMLSGAHTATSYFKQLTHTGTTTTKGSF